MLTKAILIASYLMAHEPQVPVEVAEIIGQQVVFVSEVFGINESVVLGVMEVESHFNGYSISSRGARGLMQVNPKWHTGEGNSLHGSIYHGVRILADFKNQCGGDLDKALTKYHGGKYRASYNRRVWKAIYKWQRVLSVSGS